MITLNLPVPDKEHGEKLKYGFSSCGYPVTFYDLSKNKYLEVKLPDWCLIEKE